MEIVFWGSEIIIEDCTLYMEYDPAILIINYSLIIIFFIIKIFFLR